MDMNIIYGILVAVCLSVVIMFFQKINRNKFWKGVVTNIKRIEYEDDEGFFHIQYKIYYQTENGSRSKIKVDDRTFKLYFKDFKVGSRIVKKVGKDYPELSDEKL